MKLSKRQSQIAGMIADGKDVPSIAANLKMREGTVRTQIARILKKKNLRRTSDIAPYVWKKRISRKILYIKDTQAAT